MPVYHMKIYLHIKFRRKLVLEEMAQSLYRCYFGRLDLFQRTWHTIQITRRRTCTHCAVHLELLLI